MLMFCHKLVKKEGAKKDILNWTLRKIIFFKGEGATC